jgi:hypothetical protein
MSNFKKIIGLVGSILFACMLFTNCNNPSSSTVDKIEDCLGEYKTGEQIRRISKTEGMSIGLCVLPHIKKFTTKLKNSDATTRESLLKEFIEAVNKSEYKEAIQAADGFEDINQDWSILIRRYY